MIYELIAFNTESYLGIRYREYTASKKKADLFNKIPKIQFTDSGHGIVFMASEFSGKKKPKIHELSHYVDKHLKDK